MFICMENTYGLDLGISFVTGLQRINTYHCNLQLPSPYRFSRSLTNCCLYPKRHYVQWSLWFQFYNCPEWKKWGFGSLAFWSVEQDGAFLLSSFIMLKPAVFLRACPKNQSLLQEQPLSPYPHPSAPYPFFLSFSLSFYLWILKLFSGNWSSFKEGLWKHIPTCKACQ